VGGLLTSPGKYNDKQMENVRTQWKEKYEGSSNVGKTGILPEGWDYKRIGIPPEDAQYIETEQHSVEDICRWFRVPPHKIQHLLRATFSNIEHQAIEYGGDTLQPWLQRWEEEIAIKLFEEDDEFFCEHKMQALMRGDSATRGAFYFQQYQIGALSTNDIRDLENMNPVDGGDEYFRPANLVPLVEEEEPEDPNPPPGMFPPPQNPPPAPPGQEDGKEEDGNPPEDGGPDTDPADALFPVFLDAAARVVRLETAATVRAAEKNRGNLPKFQAWADGFFDEDRMGQVSAVFRPAVVALLTWTGKNVGYLAAREHVNSARGEAVEAFTKGKAEEYEATEADRAQALARLFMKEIDA
jgi:hypothetical protein